tara:strand:+ start:1623 stop:2642 length:1020 start_codon:yes stop_codon:yes gene_type:complete
MKVLIRTDGSLDLGYGHVYKTLWLAEVLCSEKCDVRFLISSDPQAETLVKGKGFDLKTFSSGLNDEKKADILMEETAEIRPDYLIIDHWTWSTAYWNRLTKIPGTFIVGNDVPENKFQHFDIAFQGIKNDLTNKNFTQKGCRVFSGPDYLMVNPEFKRYANRWKPDFQLKNILLTFGGGDRSNLSTKVLATLDSFCNPLSITLVLGPGACRKEDLKLIVNNRHALNIVQNASYLPEWMIKCDVAIVSGGAGTLSELALTGTPAVALAGYDNQLENVRKFSRVGGIIDCAEYVGEVPESLKGILIELYSNPQKLYDLSRKWNGLVDGNGINRMTSILLKY